MKLPENFEIPKQHINSHDTYQVKVRDRDGWYLVPKEAFANIEDTTVPYECWLINPNGTIANHPYQMTIVDLGLYSGE